MQAKVFNVSERTIWDRVRVGEAILNGFFDEKTVKRFKEDKITFTELREKLNAFERLKKEKEEVLSKKHEKNQESNKEKDPKKPKVDSKPDTPKQEKDSIPEEKRLEETLPVPPSPPPQEVEQETPPPGLPGGPTIQVFDSETKTTVDVPATCKYCPLGIPFACPDCKCSMVHCIPDCNSGRVGIYRGTHFVCERYGGTLSKED